MLEADLKETTTTKDRLLLAEKSAGTPTPAAPDSPDRARTRPRSWAAARGARGSGRERISWTPVRARRAAVVVARRPVDNDRRAPAPARAVTGRTQHRNTAQILDGAGQRDDRDEVRARVVPKQLDQLAAAQPFQVQVDDAAAPGLSASAPERLPDPWRQRSPCGPLAPARTEAHPWSRDQGPPVKSLHDLRDHPYAPAQGETGPLARGGELCVVEGDAGDMRLFGRDLSACKRFQGRVTAGDQLEQTLILLQAALLVRSRLVEHRVRGDHRLLHQLVDADRRSSRRPRCALRRRSRAAATPAATGSSTDDGTAASPR